MINTIYSQVSHSLDPIITSASISSENSRIHSLSSDYPNDFHPTKKEQLRQINLIMRQKINNMTHQFNTLQKSFAKKQSLAKTIGERLRVKKQNYPQDHGFKNTISTQLDQMHFDQLQPEQAFLNYDSSILSQKNIKQKILNVYELIQKYQNADHIYKINIQLEEYTKLSKAKGVQNRQYTKTKTNHNERLDNSSAKTKQYLKPSYIAYTDQHPSERMIQEEFQMKNKNKSNNKRVDTQNYHNQVEVKHGQPSKKSSKDNLNKGLYKAIEERIVTSSCTFNSIPMSKGINKVEYLAARMHKQTIQRQNLIDQFKKSHINN